MKTIKALPAPITIVININIRTWWDKTYGNSYSSAQIVVNNCYDGVLVIPFQYNNARNTEYEVYKLLRATYPELSELSNYSSEQLAAGTLVNVTVRETTKKLAKAWG